MLFALLMPYIQNFVYNMDKYIYIYISDEKKKMSTKENTIG